MFASRLASAAAAAGALGLLSACASPRMPGPDAPSRVVTVDHWTFEVSWEGYHAQAVAMRLPDWDNVSLTRMASLRALERATFCTPRLYEFDERSNTMQAVMNCAIAPLM